MVAFNVVGRFRQQNDLHAYRRRLANEIRQDFILSLLPALLDLPIPVVDAQGQPCDLAELVRAGQHVTLAGRPGSGRRLVLQQRALSWATAEGPPAPLPALLSLAQLDDGVSAPDHLLAEFTRATAQSIEAQPIRDPLAFLRRSAATEPGPPPAPSLLLIWGWEELQAERRASWRATLIEAAQSSSALSIALTHPHGEPAWPGFMPLAIAPVTPALLQEWVERLAPTEQQARLLASLEPGGALHTLSRRLFEVALLAWQTPRRGLPTTRGELYAWALADLLDLPDDRLAAAPIVQELQLLAGYDERPQQLQSSLIAAGNDGAYHFIHPQIGHYLAARQLLAEQRYEPLLRLGGLARTEIALPLATMLDDPAPLFATLWRGGHPHAEDLLTLGRCLSERAPASPLWTLRVVGALASLAHQGSAEAREQAGQILADCMPALDLSLETLPYIDDSLQQFLKKLFELLPTALATPRMLQLSYHTKVDEQFAWWLADRVVEQAVPEAADTTPAVADPPVQARWIYIQALRNAREHRRLDPSSATVALAALAASAAGETRKLHAAAALLDDLTQVPATRLAALELLTHSVQPVALTVIERASADTNPEVRAAALNALGARAPERAAIALGRAAIDATAPWELRLEAILGMGKQPVGGADRVLEYCASDSALPLYARLQAVAALARQPESMRSLRQLASDTMQHLEIRAAAARQLGIAGQPGAADEIIQLLDNPNTPPALAQNCCIGLAALRTPKALPALLRLIERTADVALAEAALHALGQLGDPAASAPLSRLLGAEALHRLQQTVEPRLHGLPLSETLHDPALPYAIALRLAAALAASPTPDAQPSTLSEFLAAEADIIRSATAQALAMIGGNQARAALLAALLDGHNGGATAALITALASVEGPDSAEALGYLLDSSEVNPLTRWLIVQQLASHPAGEPIMLRALSRAGMDSFTRGALAEGLGQRGAFAALPALRQIAEDSSCAQQLRAQALLALGLLNEQASETALIRMIADPREDVELRGLAAEHLPEQLSPEGRRFRPTMVRIAHPPAPMVSGPLRALGHVRDREALPLMLRYGQDEQAMIAEAAITALTEVGDGSVAPMLVRITHHSGAEHTLRLQAAGALVRIGGLSYRPLLRGYLDQGPLPLRLLALEHLIAAGTADADLLAMLASPGWPLAMRLRIVDYFKDDTAAAPVLQTLLEAEDDHTQLRALAAEALGRMGWVAALPTFGRLAESADTPAALGLRCISALRAIGGAPAWAVLSHLAEDSSRAPAIQIWAIQELRRTLAQP